MKLESCRNLTGDEIETTITMAGNGADGFRVYTTSNSMLTKIGKFLDEIREKNSKTKIDDIIEYMKPDYIKGITLLGGEPLEQTNQQGLLPLLRKIDHIYPEKNIWCFTGYDFEKDVIGRMMKEWDETKEFMSYIDVLVDGEFMIDKKDLNLVFKGSSNQRTIMVQESLAEGRIIYWQS